MSDAVLSPRALNRATLERQLLLRRSEMAVLDAVEHLVGMQAQLPLNPYLALWSRLDRFRPDELGQLLVDRKVVRIVVMRATLHLVSAEDCLVLRPLMQPVLDQELARHPEYGPPLRGVELEPVLSFARQLVAERPRSGTQLRAALADRFPDHDAAALAYACRNRLAFVQVPPRGVWGRTAQVTSTTAESWLGRPLASDPSIDDVVPRYLAAFGPATVTGPGDTRPAPLPARVRQRGAVPRRPHPLRLRRGPGSPHRHHRAGARLGAPRRVPVRHLADRP